MILKVLHRMVVERLLAAGIPDAELEASQLLGHVLDKSRTQLFLAAEQEVALAAIERLEALLVRRLNREPLAYLVGEREFWSLPFGVNRAVLIPRPETEELVERVLATVDQGGSFAGRILDLGTGSGVIAVVLARQLPNATVYGVDRSMAALGVAAANAKRHGVDGRLHLVCSDWLTGLAPRPGFELVVSNPPYVARESLADLEPELAFEPESALDGGKGGLVEVRRLMAGLGVVLRPGGWFFMEIGADQEQVMLELFDAAGLYDQIRVFRDYAGLPRILQARRHG